MLATPSTPHRTLLRTEVSPYEMKPCSIATRCIRVQLRFQPGIYHRIERSYGSFTRSFALPSSVDADKTSAEYKDGVLTLTMPKIEEAKHKTIQIRRAENQNRSPQV